MCTRLNSPTINFWEAQWEVIERMSSQNSDPHSFRTIRWQHQRNGMGSRRSSWYSPSFWNGWKYSCNSDEWSWTSCRAMSQWRKHGWTQRSVSLIDNRFTPFDFRRKIEQLRGWIPNSVRCMATGNSACWKSQSWGTVSYYENDTSFWNPLLSEQ